MYKRQVYGINQWYSEKSDWVNQTGGVTGHYEQLINPRLTYVGLALFSPKQGGWNTTSGEFCSEADLYETQAEAAKDVIQTIEVTKSSITATSLDVYKRQASQQSCYADHSGFGDPF